MKIRLICALLLGVLAYWLRPFETLALLTGD